jgi:5-formyltetrahydrofolate cyclo-ligase
MDAKAEIRRRARAARDALPPDVRAAWSQHICARILGLPAYRQAQVIHAFLPMHSEVDTLPVIAQALADQKCLAVPALALGEPCAVRLAVLDEVIPSLGRWGIPFNPDRLVAPEQIDLALVPLVAYAPVGASGKLARLGYGSGYYDRFLRMLRPDVPKIGLAFSVQRAAEIPLAPHDVLLDAVITEQT